MIFGDICPTEDTRALFDNGVPETLMGGLVQRIRAADLAVANLECALTETSVASEKIGPVLKGRFSDAQMLADAGFDLVGLANNHIKDCGPEGVLDTLQATATAGLRTTGAGRDATAASSPAIVEAREWRIGFMAVAEHEFNAASATEAGAHVFDPLQDLERLRALKSKCDYVVVLYHGGIEYFDMPSPVLQRTCRALVRNGADIVLCQHSHIIGTFETYEGGHILYGQGNAVFGYRSGKPTWNEGLAVAVSLSRNSGISADIELLPICCDPTGKVDLQPPEQAQACLSALAKRSRLAEDPKALAKRWSDFCRYQAANQLGHALGLGLWLTRANRLLKGQIVQRLYGRRQRMVAHNVLRCNAHREVALVAFEQSLEAEISRKERR